MVTTSRVQCPRRDTYLVRDDGGPTVEFPRQGPNHDGAQGIYLIQIAYE